MDRDRDMDTDRDRDRDKDRDTDAGRGNNTDRDRGKERDTDRDMIKKSANFRKCTQNQFHSVFIKHAPNHDHLFKKMCKNLPDFGFLQRVYNTCYSL